MSIQKKLFEKIMFSDNIKFSELQLFLEQIGFEHRIKGDHFIYYKNGISEIINIQPDGNKAKPYQIKQIRKLVIKYHLGGGLYE